jgi:dCMP deaminase
MTTMSESRRHRPSWDEWALGLAGAVAARADCTRRQVGAVVLDADRRVLSVGYNGAPPGARGCLTAGACPRGRQTGAQVPPGSSYDTGPGSCIANHAEANALLYSDPLRRRGGTLYVTHEPCGGCSRLLAGSGLSRAVWPEGERLL